MKNLIKCRIYYGIIKLFVRRQILGRGKIRRTKDFVGEEYEASWKRSIERLYTLDYPLRPELLGNKLIWCREYDHRKFFLDHLNHQIAALKPTSVLELGSGYGINLLALAVMHPDVQTLTGIELTSTGLEASQKLLKNPPLKLLSILTNLKEPEIKKRLPGRKIEFVRGDITKMPFENKSFDFAFSMWVLEQLPRNYLKVFSEARRVTKGHILFLEAFREAQNIFQLLHLRNLDYFRGSFHEVEKAGLEVVKFEPLALSKIKFRNAALLCCA